MLTFEKDGLYAGHVNVWGDWAAHISYVSALATQPFFPPQFPILAGHVLSYPFGADLLSALLLRAGAGFLPALIIPSYILSLVLVVVLFVFYRKILQGAKAATVAVFLFLLNGGLGFLWFLKDLQAKGFGILTNLPREYTLLRGEPNIEWINIIISELIPQRGFLLGFPIALLVLLVFWKVYEGSNSINPKHLLAAGVATGLMPLIHMHSFFVILGVFSWTVVLSLAKKRGLHFWLPYLIPTTVLAIPIIAVFYPQFGTSHIKFQFGWLAGQENDNILFFWLKNAGVAFFLPVFGLLVERKQQKYRELVLWSIPFWGLFVAANLFIFQPYEWDNTKFFTYWWLLGAGFGALFLQSLLTKTSFKILALLLFLLSTLSGSLDVLRVTWCGDLRKCENLKIRMLTNQDLELAEWAKKNTSQDAIFLTADNHDNPLAMLSGRRIVLGFRGWLWTYGIDTGERTQKVERIYQGENAKAFLTEFSVDYILLGNRERRRYQSLNENFFENNFGEVYRKGDVRIFKVANGR